MGPGSGQVNAICGHHGQEAADAFTGRRLQLWGTRVAAVSLPWGVVLLRLYRIEAAGSWLAASGQGVAVGAQGRLLATEQGAGLSPQGELF